MAERVLFVHAHPDDETISTGATIATLVSRGAEVTVVTCTRGERGEVIPADLQHLIASPTELGEYRVGELQAALAALGVTDHRMLGAPGARWEGRAPRRYLDSGMRWGAAGAEPLDAVDSGSLVAAELGEVAADIAAVLIELEPDVVVSYDARGGYGHPDHIRVHEATRTAAEVIGVPFYVIDELGTASALTVDAGPVADLKRSALAAYRTQVVLDGDTFSLSSGEPRPVAAPERFSRLRAAEAGFADTAFADYTLSSRIFSGVLALVLGAFAGGLLAITHSEAIGVAGVSVPWGIIAGALISTGLLAGLRLVFETRVIAACAAVGLVAASTLLALQARGGLPQSTAGPGEYLWMFAPVVISVLVLAWPRRRRVGGARRREG